MGDLTKNFSKKEFACKCGCGKDDIDKDLVTTLQFVRDKTPFPMIINSGVRCEKHNKEVGGKSSSSHLVCKAVDIKCDNSVHRIRLIDLLLDHFKRIGIGEDFIHVDIDSNKPQNVCWVYPSSQTKMIGKTLRPEDNVTQYNIDDVVYNIDDVVYNIINVVDNVDDVVEPPQINEKERTSIFA